jgi:glyoxylase-like metal-dependent hydrolase (beta-lactamase superfamily II)
VRYAVNTHFHWDHAQGNHAYPVAFPRQVAIVASEATRENLIQMGMKRVKDQIDAGPGQVAELEKRIAATADAAARAKLQDELAQQQEYLAEIRSLELKLPDLTFDKSLILHRPDRDIMLLFLGRGHTSGDVVAYLPKQKVVATGDLLHGWMPFMGDSYPPEWVATLDALDKLDFDHIVGGHGSVKPRSHLRFFRNYLADLIAAVRAARGRGETLDQAKKSVTAALAPNYEAGMDGASRLGRRQHREGLKDLEEKRPRRRASPPARRRRPPPSPASRARARRSRAATGAGRRQLAVVR